MKRRRTFFIFFLGSLSLYFWGQKAQAGSTSPPPSLRVYDRNGLSLGTLLSPSETYCDPVSLEALSPWLILSTIATEDKRFYFHSGVDFKAALRAIWQNARQGRVVSGASTLTEQLARFLEPYPKTLSGKIHEAWDALSLEKKMSKHDILQSYFNSISYGNQCQGVEAAARRYFGVHSRDLSLAQSAYLAAIPKSPQKYDPYRHPDMVFQRQTQILSALKNKGWVDANSFRLAMEERVRPRKKPGNWSAPHLLMFLNSHYGGQRESLVTTLDLSLQRDLEELLRSQLQNLKSNHVTNGALLVVDVHSGDILAWVGSGSFADESTQGQVDGVTSLRQPGSSLKPFLYGLAFSRGYKTSDLLLDEPTYTQGGYIPKNYDEQYHGWVRMRTALACSYNVPAIRLTEKITAESFLEFLHFCGFQSLDQTADHYGLGLSLGDGEITMLESAAAYAALARGGYWKPLRILQNEDSSSLLGGGKPHRILDPRDAFLVTSVLSDNVARSGSFGLYSPLLLPFPFAAKTGTTKDYRDNWAVGYTPDWVIAVWVGNFDGTAMRHVSGITGAGPLLHDAAMRVAKSIPPHPFPEPAGIRHIEICSLSGDLPGPGCRNRLTEIYDDRFVPKKICSLHSGTSHPEKDKARIIFPRQGDIFKINPVVFPGSQSILLQTNQESGFFFELDGQKISMEDGKAWWALAPGRHQAALWLEKNGTAVKTQTIHFLVIP